MAEEKKGKKSGEKAGIISAVQEMVKSGESEESIIKSLREMGVKPNKAKRLLLLAQADTFALLQSEISKIVKGHVEEEKPKLVAFIKKEAEKAEEEMVEKVEKRALNAFKEDQQFIENQAAMFQARVNQSVKNIMDLNQQTKQHLAELGSRLSNIERDVWALKQRVFGSKMVRMLSITLILLQVAIVGTSLYLLFNVAGKASTESVLLAAVSGAILAAMVYLIGLKG